MRQFNRSIVPAAVLALANVFASGCGWWGGEDESLAEVPPADAVVDAAPAEPPPAAKLELRLNVGDRFPLVKTVSQELAHASPDGPAVGRSRLDLLMAITVEEVRDGHRRLGVQYHRVRYRQEVAGETIEYDSNAPQQAALPLDVMPYRGLVNNGFSFWVGPDNRIVEPVGFQAFLERCVRDVPPDRRGEVLERFAGASADEGIANFVDESIGLLPYNAGDPDGPAVSVGRSWTVERRLKHPTPLLLTTRCTLRELNERTAEVEILGDIDPAAAWDGPVRHAGGDAAVEVRTGRSFGSCTIDRQTGLPLRSQIERHLDLIVRLPNGTQLSQRKKVVTTVRAVAEQDAARP